MFLRNLVKRLTHVRPTVKMPRRRAVLGLEQLDSRIMPSATHSYTWNPIAPGGVYSTDWKSNANWNGNFGVGYPGKNAGDSDSVTFDGLVSNHDCSLDNVALGENVLVNFTIELGFTSKVTLNQDIILGGAFAESSNAELKLNNAFTLSYLSGSSTWSAGKITGNATTGSLHVDSGVATTDTTILRIMTDAVSLGVPLTIGGGSGTLNGNAQVKLTSQNSQLSLTDGITITTAQNTGGGTGGGALLFEAPASGHTGGLTRTGSSYIVNNSILEVSNTASNGQICAVPITSAASTSSFDMDNASWFKVSGTDGHTGNVSIYGDGGVTQFGSQGTTSTTMTLTADGGWKQVSGKTTIKNNSVVNLYATTTFTGGSLYVGDYQTSSDTAQFNVITNSLTIGGTTVYINLKGTVADQCGSISASGTGSSLTLNSGNSLIVYVDTASITATKTWDVFVCTVSLTVNVNPSLSGWSPGTFSSLTDEWELTS